MPFITQGKANIKYLLLVIVLAAVAGGGILAYQYWWIPKQETNNQANLTQNNIDETAGWQTYRNEEYGFEFRYPENFGANVWRPFFWPATTTVVIEEDPVKKGCPNFPTGIQGATQETVKINNIDYTLYKASDGALGSSYLSYCYVAEKDQKYYVIDFVIRTTNGCGDNCSVYCGTQYETECKNFDLANDVEKPIENILSTFKFIEASSIKLLSPNGEENVTSSATDYEVKWSISNITNLENYYVKLSLLKGKVILGKISNKTSSATNSAYNWGWIGAGNYLDANANLKTAIVGNDYKIRAELYQIGGSAPVAQDESDNYFRITK